MIFQHFSFMIRPNDHAKELVVNTLDLNNFRLGGLPEFKEIKSLRQENSYDCGPYIMLYIREIVNNIIAGNAHNSYFFNKDEATKFRVQLHEIIRYRIAKTKTAEKPKEEAVKTNNDKGVDMNKKTALTNIQYYANVGYPRVTAGDGKTKNVSFIIRRYAGST